MARIKLSLKVLILSAIVLISTVFLVFNVSRYSAIRDLSNESGDANGHLDMQQQLRNNLKNRAMDLAIELKAERETLLELLGSMQQHAEAEVGKNIVKPVLPTGAHPAPPSEAKAAPVAPKDNLQKDLTAVSAFKIDLNDNRRNPKQDPTAIPHGSDVSLLPGADKHPILRFSDSELKNIPVSAMIAMYGPTTGTTPGTSCEDDFGNGLVNRWRDTKQNYCSSNDKNKGKIDGSSSSIDCYLVKQTRHSGAGDNICVMENVSVHMDLFGHDKAMYQVVKEYEATRHMRQPYVQFPIGFIQSDCKTDPHKWKVENMPGWNSDLTVKAVTEASQNVKCDEWIEQPVLIDQRDTFANFFHDSEDFVNVFLALGVLQISVGEIQVYLTDLYPEGPFWDIWMKPFGVGHKPMTAWDLKKRFGHDGKVARNTCYRKLIIGIYGPASPLTVASWDTGCKSSALVKAYSDFIIRGMGLQSLTHYQNAKPSKNVQITFMARRSSSEWPEKRFCDSQNSFFLCEYWSKWGLRSLQRTLQNEVDLLAMMKKLEMETFSNGAVVTIKDVDYNLLSFEEQIKTDLQTDIMIGPHGAGLMHSLFMRDRASLIEMFVDGSGANRHFHNMAFWYGRNYRGIGGNHPEEVMSALRTFIETMDLNEY